MPRVGKAYARYCNCESGVVKFLIKHTFYEDNTELLKQMDLVLLDMITTPDIHQIAT